MIVEYEYFKRHTASSKRCWLPFLVVLPSVSSENKCSVTPSVHFKEIANKNYYVIGRLMYCILFLSKDPEK